MASDKPVKSIEGSTKKRPADDDEKEEKRQKISFGLTSKFVPAKPSTNKLTSGLQIKLNSQKLSNTRPTLNKASVFNEESDDEPEEMPREARMVMRNIGRDTPTSAGPNSFGKTKQGFCNVKKVFEKNLKATADLVSDDRDK